MLFGSLQKITAQQLGFNPILIVTANSTGGVMGKMIDAQSIVVATASTGQVGQEGRILRFVFWHSVALAAHHGRDRDAAGLRLPVDDPVRRWHLFELEDQSWFPAVIRDLATDYLQFIQTRFRIDRAMAPLVRRVLEAEPDATRIVDLCSGGSGPLLLLVKDLAAAGVPIHGDADRSLSEHSAFDADRRRVRTG